MIVLTLIFGAFFPQTILSVVLIKLSFPCLDRAPFCPTKLRKLLFFASSDRAFFSFSLHAASQGDLDLLPTRDRANPTIVDERKNGDRSLVLGNIPSF
ncbi:MAG: hypothetical protein AB4290_21500 [Spirulina sp.]